MKVILKYLVTMVVPILGKLLAYVWTPVVFGLRHSARSYVWNYMLSRGHVVPRMHVCYEDDYRYELKNGYIHKRDTNVIVFALWYAFVYVWCDDDAWFDYSSGFILRTTHKVDSVTDTSFMVDNVIVDLGIKVNVAGSYFEIGDRQAANTASIWSSWEAFRAFYYWTVIRNGFYNWNYTVEEAITNKVTGRLSKVVPTPRLKTDKYDGVSKVNVAASTFGSEFGTYSDEAGNKWGIAAVAKKIGNRYYGFELGWRRQGGNINQVARITVGKVGV